MPATGYQFKSRFFIYSGAAALSESITMQRREKLVRVNVALSGAGAAEHVISLVRKIAGSSTYKQTFEINMSGLHEEAQDMSWFLRAQDVVTVDMPNTAGTGYVIELIFLPEE